MREAVVRLVPLGREHEPEIDAMLDDPDLLRNTRVPEPPPPGFARTWVDRYTEGRRDGTRDAFAIVDPHGTFLGVAVAASIDTPARTLELGYVVAPAARGRGVATAALRELTAWAFDVHDAVRLELQIDVGNLASKRVAAKCGYVFEGVRRSAHVKQQRWSDTEVWSRLATDP